mgnify:CR=1 FL=1
MWYVHCLRYTVLRTLSYVHCLTYTVLPTLSCVLCLTYTVLRTLSYVHCLTYTVLRTLSYVHCLFNFCNTSKKQLRSCMNNLFQSTKSFNLSFYFLKTVHTYINGKIYMYIHKNKIFDITCNMCVFALTVYANCCFLIGLTYTLHITNTIIRKCYNFKYQITDHNRNIESHCCCHFGIFTFVR